MSAPSATPVVVKLMDCGPKLGGFKYWLRHFCVTLGKFPNLTHLSSLKLRLKYCPGRVAQLVRASS